MLGHSLCIVEWVFRDDQVWIPPDDDDDDCRALVPIVGCFPIVGQWLPSCQPSVMVCQACTWIGL